MILTWNFATALLTWNKKDNYYFKNIDNAVIPTNSDSILVFRYRDNLEQHNTLIPESWYKIFNVLLTISLKVSWQKKEILIKSYRQNQKLTKLIIIIENQGWQQDLLLKTRISVFTFQTALPIQNHFINMQVEKLKALKV